MPNTPNSTSTVARTRHLPRSRACPTSCPNALRFTLLSVTLPTEVRWPSPSAQLNREATPWRADLKMVLGSDFDIHSEFAERMRPVPLARAAQGFARHWATQQLPFYARGFNVCNLAISPGVRSKGGKIQLVRGVERIGTGEIGLQGA